MRFHSFALSNKAPTPVVAGIMWSNPDRSCTRPCSTRLSWFCDIQTAPELFRQIRHTCEQGEVQKYGWTAHDGASFGIHEVEEKLRPGSKIVTSYIKHPGGPNGAHNRIAGRLTSSHHAVRCQAATGA